MMNLVLQMMNSALNMMNFVFKMMNFALKLVNISPGNARAWHNRAQMLAKVRTLHLRWILHQK